MTWQYGRCAKFGLERFNYNVSTAAITPTQKSSGCTVVGWIVLEIPRSNRGPRSSARWTRRLFGSHFRAVSACAFGLSLPFFHSASLRSQSITNAADSERSAARRAYASGLSLVKQGHFDDAIRTFERGLQADGRNVALLDAIGATLSVQGDFEHAQPYFLETLQLDPGFVPARKNLAITYFHLGQYALAVAEFQKLAVGSLDSQRVASLFLGIIAESSGDYARSAELFARSGSLLDQYPQALLSFANSLDHLAQSRKAVAILRRLDTAHGVPPDEYFKAGELYSRLGQPKRALANFDKSEKMGARPEGLQYQRAVALDKLGQSQEALQILKDLTNTKPNSDSLNLLAHVAEKNQQFELAVHSLRLAAKLDPGQEDNYLDFSTFCADYENFPLALESAEIGLEHIPNSYRLLVQKGAILEKLARLDEAESVLQSAAPLQDDNSVALLSLAIVQSHADKLQDSFDTLTNAISRFPGNYYMHYHLGSVLIRIAERDGPQANVETRAARAFRDAIRLNPAFADSYYQLAKLYAPKAPKLAEKNLVACLRADPNHAAAEYTLGRLYMKTGRKTQGQVLIDRFESQQQAAKRKEQSQPRIAAQR
jgi:tetratricopeptide (TPR) repeat protein